MKKTGFILLVVILFLVAKKSEASHIQGGEINWECIHSGPDAGKFIFKLKIYWACSYDPCPATITISNPLYAFYGGPSAIPVTRIGSDNLYSNCFDQTKQVNCAGPNYNFRAFKVFYYKSTPVQINGIPSVTGSPFWVWACCRASSALTENINGSGYYLRAIMFPYTDPITGVVKSMGSASNGPSCYDSSPELAAKPRSMFCGKRDMIIDERRVDIENDSLHYEWAVPMQNSSTSVTYKSGYSVSEQIPDTSENPLNVSPVLNPNTGIVTFKTFTPINSNYFAIGLKTTAYKNGQKVSEVYQDRTITIVDCDTISYTFPIANNGPPSIEFKESNASIYQSAFNKTYPIGTNIELDIKATDVGILPVTPIALQSVSMEVHGYAMSSFPNNTTACKTGPCAYLDSSSSSWTGSIFMDTTINIVKFKWNTSCLNLENNPILDSSGTKTFHFYVSARDNWCPVPGQNGKHFYITLADSNQSKIKIDSIDASNLDAYIHWPEYLKPNFISYELYRKNNINDPWSFLTSIGNSSSNSFLDSTSAKDTTSVFYQVHVNNNLGCDLEYDLRTIYLTATNSGKNVNLNWNSSYFEHLINSGKFIVLRSTNGSPWYAIDTVAFDSTFNASSTDIVYSNQQRVDYKVESYDSRGLWSISNIDTIRRDTMYTSPVSNVLGQSEVLEEFQFLKYSSLNSPGSNELDILIYPNPGSNKVILELRNFHNNMSLMVFDIQGNIISEENITSGRAIYDVSDWKSGLYYLQIKDETGRIYHKKFVKSD